FVGNHAAIVSSRRAVHGSIVRTRKPWNVPTAPGTFRANSFPPGSRSEDAAMSVTNVLPAQGLEETPRPVQPPIDAPPPWSLAWRVAFRFVAVYFPLYIFPFPLDSIPKSETVLKYYRDAVDAMVLWVGAHVFGTEITVRTNGSGDTTWDYVRVFCLLCL